MHLPRPSILVVAASVALLLAGCSVSSVPPEPLQAAPTASLPSGTTNTAYAANLSAGGGVPPYSWSVASGNVPPGLVLNNAGTLSGTPSSAGSFSFTAQVTALAHPTEVASVVVSVTVVDPLQVTTTSLPNSSVGVSYSAALAATGGFPAYTWSITQGNLPSGLTLNAATGVISGTLTVAGSSSVGVSVSDSQRPSHTANAVLTVTIAPALQITTTSLPNSSPGLFYSATMAATGGVPAYTWSIAQGSLPSGLTLNATGGVISGAPTGGGTSNFTVRISDNGAVAATSTAGLSIAITPPPARNAILYLNNRGFLAHELANNGNALRIQSDGSLTFLSNPEYASAVSPTLPLVFVAGNGTSAGTLQSMLVNPDYSLTPYSSSAQLPGYLTVLSVDPSGSNLYVSENYTDPTIGVIGAAIGVTSADGSFQLSETIPTSGITLPQLVFNPSGTLAYYLGCSPPFDSNTDSSAIESFSRAPNGMLTKIGTPVPAGCVSAMEISPDGKYLAVGGTAPGDFLNPQQIQIYSIASDGALTPAALFVFDEPPNSPSNGVAFYITGLLWDQSGSYLIVSVMGPHPYAGEGGIAVLSFSGNTLLETVNPTGGPVANLARTGSFVYAIAPKLHPDVTIGVFGFDFQNGQLTLLSGSPFPFSVDYGKMVIY